jgi:hypothetical protein
MKKILFCLMLVMVTLENCNMVYGQHYSFTSIAPSGQTLYFRIENMNAVLTYPAYEYYGYSKPTGDLVIPTEVTNDGVTYSVTEIENSTFEDCDSLTSITIPSSIIEVGYAAFKNCSALTSIEIPASVTRISFETFMNCSALTSIVIPESVTFIEYSVFENCTSLTEVYYNAIRIPYDSHWHTDIFKGCTNLSRVIFGDNVRSVLCKNLFENITSLTHVTIGTSVDSISEGVFSGCSHLTTIKSRAEIPPTITESTFEGVPAYADIIVPCGAAYRYELADYWKDFSRITEDCSEIGDVDDMQNVRVRVIDGCIVIEGVNNMEIDLFDMTGRLVGSTKDNRINVPTNGTYMIKIGNHTARKVVVVR